MTLKELLAQIKQEIANLTAKQAAGQDVAAQLAQLAGVQSSVEQQIARAGEDAQAPGASAAPAAPTQLGVGASTPPPGMTPEQELAFYRAQQQERAMIEVATRAAQQQVAEYRERQTDEATRMAQAVQQAVGAALGIGGAAAAPDLRTVVEDALRNARGASRFAADGGDVGLMNQLGLPGGLPQMGGGGLTVHQPSSLQVGEHLGVKQLREGKNLANFMGILLKAKNGGFTMTEAERLFLMESQSKAMAEGTNSAGGFLVHPEWMPDILGLLRNAAVVRSAGPRTVPFSKEMNQTSISSGATAYYTAENAHIAPSEMVLAEAPLLTPKNLTGLVPVSNYLLGDAPGADDMVRSDLAEVMSLREDLSFLQGTGGGGEPTGMRNMTGRTQNPLSLGTDGDYLTQPQTRAIRNITRTFNSQNPRWVWFWPSQFLNHLEGLTDADGRYLADSAILRINEDGRSGVYDGVPFFITNQIPVNLTTGANSDTTYLILVDINELIIGENQALELAVSTEASYTPNGGTSWISAFQATQTLFRATLRHDIAHRRPNHVIVQTGVRV